MNAHKFVAYYRVSTDKQGHSGLGLEAQQEAVTRYISSVAGETLAEFVEVESGKKNNREQLAAALAECRKKKATLVVAKLDRLSRTVSMIATLMESGTEFIACDNPHANRFTLHILAAVAEHEREMISERTRIALAAAKARGAELGKNGKALAAANRAAADDLARKLRPVIEELRAEGIRTVRATAEALNAKGIETAKGGRWHPTSTARLLRRIEATANDNQLSL